MSDDREPIPALRAYADATEVDDLTAQRIRSAVRTRAGARRSGLWPLGVGLAGTAVVAALAVGLWSAPRSGPHALDHVVFEMDGAGRVTGTDEAPVVVWDTGTIDVQVEPHRGVKLEVSTPEATIRVVGTAFTVTREHRATRVVVREGTVALTCAGREEQPVSAGGERTCLPEDPGELLLRLTELYASGATPAERVATGAAALEVASGSVRGEILAHQTRALADAGRSTEALATAEEYLASSSAARRSELVLFVARTRYGVEGCAASAALDRAAEELGPEADPERLLLATCLADAEPERSTALLDVAGPRATGPWVGVATELRERLSR